MQSQSAACEPCPARTWSGAGRPACYPRLVSATAADTNDVEEGLSVGDIITLEFSAETNQPTPPADVYSLITFTAINPSTSRPHTTSSDPVVIAAVAAASGVTVGQVTSSAQIFGPGTNLRAVWVTGTRMRLEILSTSGVDTTLADIGRLRVSLARNRISNAGENSGTHNETIANDALVGGNWGVLGAPALAAAFARDTGNAEGLGVGDSIELQFNQRLQHKTLGASLPAQSLIRLFDASGVALDGMWQGTAAWGRIAAGGPGYATTVGSTLPGGETSSVIVVTITSLTLSPVMGYPSSAAAWPSAAAKLLPGLVRVAVRATANMRGASASAATFPPANNTATIVGSWGETVVAPVFHSLSHRLGIVSWRTPYRHGTSTVAGWAAHSLEGFVVSVCAQGSTSCDGYVLPAPTSDQQLMGPDKHVAIVPTTNVPLTPSMQLTIRVAAVFAGRVGPLTPAVDSSRGSIGFARLPTNCQCFLVSFSASINSTSTPDANPCWPGTVATSIVTTPTAEQLELRSTCRCAARASHLPTQSPHAADATRVQGQVCGSDYSATLPPVVDGVEIGNDLSTSGGEYFTVRGSGLPSSVTGMRLGDDHAASLRSSAAAAAANYAARTGGPAVPGATDLPTLINPPSGVTAASVRQPVVGTAAVPYAHIEYGNGTYSQQRGQPATYIPNVADCSVVVSGASIRCLSRPGVGKDHIVRVEVDGRAPATLPAADSVRILEDGTAVRGSISYGAPYVQAFELVPRDGLPTPGGTRVRVLGRNLGPIGRDNIDSVTYAPARHSNFVFTARDCAVVEAHQVLECMTDDAAGSQSYWVITIASQKSLLPATSVALPVMSDLRLLSSGVLSTMSEPTQRGVARAALRVLGRPMNSTMAASMSTADLAQAASSLLDRIPAADQAVISSIPTRGGVLVLLTGENLGPGSASIGRVWYEEQSSQPFVREVFIQELDQVDPSDDDAIASSSLTLSEVPSLTSSSSMVSVLTPSCAMAVPHTAIVCRVLPGAGGPYFWRVRILDQASSILNKPMTYAPISISEVVPAAVPSEGLGTTLMVVRGANLPPPDLSAFPLRVQYHRHNITEVFRDSSDPYSGFSFVVPAVIVPAADAGSGDSLASFIVQLTATAAGSLALANVAISPPQITSLNVDSERRNLTAALYHAPPIPSATLVEIFGSSFGGTLNGVSVTIGGERCVPLTEQEMRVHLRSTRNNLHTELFCWTSMRNGAFTFTDPLGRTSFGVSSYSYDAIKTAPAPTQVLPYNLTLQRDVGGDAILDTSGGTTILVRGSSMNGVTSVELVLLGGSSTDRADLRPVLFILPCLIVARPAHVLLPSYVRLPNDTSDPCPEWPEPAPGDDFARVCRSRTQVVCTASLGAGDGYHVRAVASSAGTDQVGVSAAPLTRFANPVITGITPRNGPTAGGTLVTIRGRHLGPSGLPFGDTSALGTVTASIGGRPCAVVAFDDHQIQCQTPEGLLERAPVSVVVAGQSSPAPATLHFDYDPPVVSALQATSDDGTNLFVGDATLAPSGTRVLSVSDETMFLLPTRGGNLTLYGSSLAASPTVELIEKTTSVVLPCSVHGPSQRGHTVVHCEVPPAAGAAYDVVLRTAPALVGGRSVQASWTIGFRPPTIKGIWVDSIVVQPSSDGGFSPSESASSPSRRAVSLQDSAALLAAGMRPTQGQFVVHVIGDSFSASPSVTLGGVECSPVAGVVNLASPLRLGAVIAAGVIAEQRGYTSIAARLTIAHNQALPASVTSAPLGFTDQAGSFRRFAGHDLVSCVVPAGTGATNFIVTTSAGRASNPMRFVYDAPVVALISPAQVWAKGPPSVNLEIRGRNFGTQSVTTGAAVEERLINVTARVVSPVSDVSSRWAVSSSSARSLQSVWSEVSAREIEGMISAAVMHALTAAQELGEPVAHDAQVRNAVRSLTGTDSLSGESLLVGPATELCSVLLVRSAHNVLQCTPRADLPVGVVLFTVEVAQQAASLVAVLSLCPVGWYGAPGEACRECPAGAACAGGFAEPQPLPGYFKVDAQTFLECNPRIACQGAVGAGVDTSIDAVFPFTQLTIGTLQSGAGVPVLDASAAPLGLGLLPGETDPATGQVVQHPTRSSDREATPAPSQALTDSEPAVRRLQVATVGTLTVSPLGAWRSSIAASHLPLTAAFPVNGSVTDLLLRYQEEAERVTIDQCIAGYQGPRCATCAKRFYRLEGRCEPCPELAWLLIPGFLIGLMVLMGVGVYLQKKQVQLSGLSVGLDFLQILSVFASLDMDWPIEMRTMYNTVSATTFSLQILAPECTIEVTFVDKFLAVAMIPPALALASLSIVVVDFLRRLCRAYIKHRLSRELEREMAEDGLAPAKPLQGDAMTTLASWLKRPASSSESVPTAARGPRMSIVLGISQADMVRNPMRAGASQTKLLEGAASANDESKFAPLSSSMTRPRNRSGNSPPASPAAGPAAVNQEAVAPLEAAASPESKAVVVTRQSSSRWSALKARGALSAAASAAGEKSSGSDNKTATPLRVSTSLVQRSNSLDDDDSDDDDTPRSTRDRSASAGFAPKVLLFGIKASNGTTDAAIGLLFTLLYYSYLTATRNSLLPLDCVSVQAADGSGSQVVIESEPSVQCDTDLDAAYGTVFPIAVISFLAYGLGIPLIFGLVLYVWREEIFADQSMLTKGEGHSYKTNPNYGTRRRFGRLYSDFKPNVFWWRLLLLVRKSLVAAVSIMLSKFPALQASMTVLILFLSYLLHVRYMPFVSVPAISPDFLQLGEKTDSTAAAVGAQARRGTRDMARRCAWIPPSVRRSLITLSPVFVLIFGSADEEAAKKQVLTRPRVNVLRLNNDEQGGDSPAFPRAAASDRALPVTPISTPGAVTSSASARTVAMPKSPAQRAAEAGGAASAGGTGKLRRQSKALTTLLSITGGSAKFGIESSVSIQARRKPAPPPKAAAAGASALPSDAPVAEASKRSLTLMDSARDALMRHAAEASNSQEEEEARHAARVAAQSSLRFSFDYNALESSFLITSVLVLLGGIAFSSSALQRGSLMYILVVAVLCTLVILAIVSFGWMLIFELYRSLRFANLIRQARAFQERARVRAKERKAMAKKLSMAFASATTKRSI